MTPIPSPSSAVSVAAAAAAAAGAAGAKMVATTIGSASSTRAVVEDVVGDGPEESLLHARACRAAGVEGEGRACNSQDGCIQGAVAGRKLSVPYLIYCSTCLALTCSLLVTTLWMDLAPRQKKRFWRRRLHPWEEAGEALVGAALCTETLVMCRLQRWAILRDGWRILDAAIACLTLVCCFFFVFRRAYSEIETVLDDLDVPMLVLRFALQPVRMLSTATMVVRAHRLHQAGRQPMTHSKALVDPRHPESIPLGSALTPSQASALHEFLPTHLRFRQWRLAYSPKVHGTSLSTFYRHQDGPNVLVVRDAQGGLFGGFASEPWRPQVGAYGHSGEALVFQARSETPGDGGSASQGDAEVGSEDYKDILGSPESPGAAAGFDVFWAPPTRGNALQWSDTKMFGFGTALVLCEDFLRGTSGVCEAFGSRPLSPSGTDFIISDFECWHVGSTTDGD